MARTFKRPERLAALSTIDVTPLIDLAFSLLIIFMISTPLLEQSIEVILPEESTKPQTPRPEDMKIHVISIDAAGQVSWGLQTVSSDELRKRLAEAAAEDEEPIISLRADRNLRFQEVVTVIDLIKQNGLTKLSIDTEAR